MASKTAKYFVNHRLKGMKKMHALVAAGLGPTNQTNIERTDTYQALEERYREVILKQLPMESVAAEHIKNILQDEDKGAKNKAIEMFLKKVEPEEMQKDEDEKLLVVLKS